MEISDVIALLAFFISLYGAIVSTSLALSENLNLKLKYLNENFLTLSLDTKVINNHGDYLGAYNKNAYTIAIKIRIVNKSKSPTTINEFILNNKYKMNNSFNMQNSSIPTSFENFETVLIPCNSKILEKEVLKPLIELKPLSSIEGYIIFTHLDTIPKHFNIKVDAVQKSKTFHFKFDIINDYTNVEV